MRVSKPEQSRRYLNHKFSLKLIGINKSEEADASEIIFVPCIPTMEPTMQNSEINVTFVSSQTTTKTQEEEGKREGREGRRNLKN